MRISRLAGRATVAAFTALLAAASLTACIDLTIPDQDPQHRVTVVDDIAVTAPSEWRLSPSSDVSTDSDGCSVRYAGALRDADDTPLVSVKLVGSLCPGDEPLNGNLGTFPTPDDIPEPTNLEQSDLEIGTLTTFSHVYTECTNSCRDYVYDYAMVQLAYSADPTHRTLLLYAESGNGVDLPAMAATLAYGLPNEVPEQLEALTGVREADWYRPVSAGDVRDGGLTVSKYVEPDAGCSNLWLATDGTHRWIFIADTRGPVTGGDDPELLVGGALEECFRNAEVIPPSGVAQMIVAFAADPAEPLELVPSDAESGPALIDTTQGSRYEIRTRNSVTGQVLEWAVVLDGRDLVSLSSEISVP